MSEHQLKFALHELLGVHIRCKKCESPVVVATVPQLANVFDEKGCCRFCGQVVMLPHQNLLTDLGRIIEGLQKYQHLDVQLVLPRED